MFRNSLLCVGGCVLVVSSDQLLSSVVLIRPAAFWCGNSTPYVTHSHSVCCVPAYTRTDMVLIPSSAARINEPHHQTGTELRLTIRPDQNASMPDARLDTKLHRYMLEKLMIELRVSG